jgi:hypothetical protein
MSRSVNINGNLVTFTAGAANAENTITHGMRVIPRGYIVVKQSAAGRLYRPTEVLVAGGDMGASFVGGWEMETGAGLIADSGPNSYTLTNNNVVTSVAGKVGNAGSFVAASSQSLSRASEVGLQMGDIDFTIAAWVKMTTHVAHHVFVSKFNTGAANFEYQLIYNVGVDRFLMYVYKADGVGVTANDITVPANGTWYLLIGWHDATADTVNIQVNNTAAISAATGAALQAAGTGNLGIGYRALAGSELYANALIDQVMIWKRVLTSTERTALYNSGNGITVTDALAPNVTQLKPWTSTQAFLKSSIAGVTYTVLFFA